MIELKNLNFSYGKEPFLNVDISFFDGCLTVLLGENGAGKTTLLKLINGIERAKAGSIVIDGCDILQMSKKETAKKLAYFPQSRPIPDMSVMQTVLLGRYPHGYSKADIDFVQQLLKDVRVDEFENRNMKTLSFGERQRVYLAMLLAQDTKNCVFDEPVNFMDAFSAFSMMDKLRRMCDDGRCIVCVLHDISLAMSYANKIVIMKNGTIADEGTPEEIYTHKSVDEIFGIHLEKYTSDGKTAYLPLPR